MISLDKLSFFKNSSVQNNYYHKLYKSISNCRLQLQDQIIGDYSIYVRMGTPLNYLHTTIQSHMISQFLNKI